MCAALFAGRDVRCLRSPSRRVHSSRAESRCASGTDEPADLCHCSSLQFNLSQNGYYLIRLKAGKNRSQLQSALLSIEQEDRSSSRLGDCIVYNPFQFVILWVDAFGNQTFQIRSVLDSKSQACYRQSKIIRSIFSVVPGNNKKRESVKTCQK